MSKEIKIHCKYDELVSVKKLEDHPKNLGTKWAIAAYSDEYIVSDFGFVVNLKNGKVLKPIKSGYKKQYCSVVLWKNRKRIGSYYVHRLVLESFVDPAIEMQAAHLDGNHQNNNLENLKWCTPLENTSHKYKHGTILFGDKHQKTVIASQTINKIIKSFLSGKNASAIAKELNVSNSHISSILRGSRRNGNIYCPLVIQQIEKNKEKIKSQTARKNTPWK